MNSLPPQPKLYASQHLGFSLIEVLITVLILAIGSLGIASLQLSSLKYSSGAYGRTQAVLLSNDLADRIRANRQYTRTDGSKYILNNFSDQYTASRNCHTEICSEAEIAEFDVQQWLSDVSRLLPFGQGKINVITTSSIPPITTIEVSLQWRQSVDNTETNNNTIGDQQVKSLTFRSEI